MALYNEKQVVPIDWLWFQYDPFSGYIPDICEAQDDGVQA